MGTDGTRSSIARQFHLLPLIACVYISRYMQITIYQVFSNYLFHAHLCTKFYWLKAVATVKGKYCGHYVCEGCAYARAAITYALE